MKSNLLFKLLSSIPIILISLYFIPFLGICLIILRCFIYNKKIKSTSTIIVIVGLLLLIPKGLTMILDLLKQDINLIPYLSDIINNDLYNNNLLNYSNFLIIIGVILLIISLILTRISNKASSVFNNYLRNMQNQEAEISRKNDMEIKLKQERAKTTNYIRCKKCGSDNIISDKISTCVFCRSALENPNYK